MTNTTTHSKPTLTKHLKNPIEVAKVVEDNEEKLKDKKRKAHFSQGITLATSFEEKKAEYFQDNLVGGKLIA